MRRRLNTLFPTYVLTLLLAVSHSALAAKDAPAPNLDETANADNAEGPADPEKEKSVDIAPAPPPRPSQHKPEFFYKYRNELSPMMGIAYDTKAIDDERSGTLTVLSMRYHFATDTLAPFEIGAELLSNGSGAFAAQKRYNFSRTSLRPYTAIGAGIRIVPNDEIATLLKYEHYQLRASAGLEYLVYDPASFRIDVTGAITIKSVQVQALLGGVWAW
jgi:hypothetical protein